VGGCTRVVVVVVVVVFIVSILKYPICWMKGKNNLAVKKVTGGPLHIF